MDVRFDVHGHLELSASEFFGWLEAKPDRLADLLTVGTPRAFATYRAYADFIAELSLRLHVHPRSILVRGSGLLGFSTCPRQEKAWQPFRKDGDKPSDIDIAIMDVDCFDRLDSDIQRWEQRQGPVSPQAQSAKNWARRQTLRAFNCVFTELMPPSTCSFFCDVLDTFDTVAFLGTRHGLSAMVFRDWWSVRARWRHDLRPVEGHRASSRAPPLRNGPAAAGSSVA